MSEQPASRETLRYNPANAVTAVVERVRYGDGVSRVRKELRDPAAGDAAPGPTANRWIASTDPRHWNYWRREAEAYSDEALREGLAGTGLAMPQAEVVRHPSGVTLWLEDVAGIAGTEFELADHHALAAALGRWQGLGPQPRPWTSTGFLRSYSGGKQPPLQLLDDDAAWRQPLVADLWPSGLRDGWRRLLAHREYLLDVMERLPRTRSHLDFWVSNLLRRPCGEFVLLDWAFSGDGAVGEDLGNHIPDAAFDLFWPAENIAELDSACVDSYLAGLREAGWTGSAGDARLGVVASCVKYTWLLPGMLARAAESEHRAYHQAVDAQRLYQQRGLAFEHLLRWLDEALALAGR